ncbi:LysR family transcriptional regulator [Actinomadura flavalba]|uniref:LysR family transcriptional regulator n=1 Tax=Actinomadura flavalba TaxID=1120938 RepID=UPI0003806DF8|nr:LysR family transcriptional regulator [Actinomadura flavalba]
MDADIPGLRAFVAAADDLHFGRAAARLHLTQQALSKRVRRLETALGAELFARTTRRVALTAAGERLLPAARAALDAFDAAVATVRAPTARLRVDVYDERFSPLRLLRGLGVPVEASMRQGLAHAVPALLGGEIDLAFGQYHELPDAVALRGRLARRLVHLEPMAAFVGPGHPLAGRGSLRPAELPAVAMPDPVAAESRAFLAALAGHFGVPLRFLEPALGLRHYAEVVRDRPEVVLGELGTEMPEDGPLVRLPLTGPVPLAPWCAVWRRDDRSPRLHALLRRLPSVRVPGGDGFWAPPAYYSAFEQE